MKTFLLILILAIAAIYLAPRDMAKAVWWNGVREGFHQIFHHR